MLSWKYLDRRRTMWIRKKEYEGTDEEEYKEREKEESTEREWEKEEEQRNEKKKSIRCEKKKERKRRICDKKIPYMEALYEQKQEK